MNMVAQLKINKNKYGQIAFFSLNGILHQRERESQLLLSV